MYGRAKLIFRFAPGTKVEGIWATYFLAPHKSCMGMAVTQVRESARLQLVRIVNSQSIDDVEAFLSRIIEYPDCDILVGPTTRNTQFGGIASLIQLLITWANRSKNGKLVTYIPNESQITPQMRNLAQDDYGLAALLVAPHVTTSNRTHDLDLHAYEYARARVKNIGRGLRPRTSGSTRLLICADDLPQDLLPQFYNIDPQTPASLKSETSFVLFFRDVTTKLLATYHDIPSLESTDALGCVTYELFKNTWDWAVREWNGVLINRSIRGIRLELVRGSRERILSHIGRCHALRSYATEIFDRFGKAEQPFLEISIFDSGSGIAEVFGKEALTSKTPLQTEYQLVIDALKKWSSSSSKTHRGVGLYRVMKTLTENAGLLRLRTGRLSLVRDFLSNPYCPPGGLNASDNSLDMFDWRTGTADLCGYTRVAGTLISILLPLKTTKK